MIINQLGVDLIKSFEGCRLQAYRDSTGVWTVGFGCTGRDVVKGTVWTQEQADSEFKQHLEEVSRVVDKLVKVDVNENQFSALVSLAYNIGVGNLEKSKLMTDLNHYDNRIWAANEFPKWDKAGGVESQGLLRRRLAEQKLFNTPCIP
jgi:lysozyme